MFTKVMLVVAIVLLLFIGAVVFVMMVSLTSDDRTALLSPVKTLEFGGLDRQYRVVEPKGNVQTIIVGLHGFGDTSWTFSYYTGLHNVVDDNTLVVYPEASEPQQEGFRKGWNAGFCCGSGWDSGVDDVAFLSEVIEQVKREYNPSAKVFMTGFSNGAMMTMRMAVDRPDLVDGVAPRSGSIGTLENFLEPMTPVPILLTHGAKDVTVPFTGGSGDSVEPFNWKSFDDASEAWQSVNRPERVPTQYVVHDEDAHVWHDWRTVRPWHTKPAGSQEIINFFYSL